MKETKSKGINSWRKNNPDKYRGMRRRCKNRYVTKFPKRQIFAYKVCKLLKKGTIQKTPCVECGSKKFVQACSMSNVYDPLWLCDRHNKELHKRVRGYT